MTIQRVVHAIPVAVAPAKFVRFERATLLPGVTLQRFVGPLSRDIGRRVEHFPEKPGFSPSHLIVVHQDRYFAGLDERLALDGQVRPQAEFDYVDAAGVARQILMAITLVGRLTWQVGGRHTFDLSDHDFPYRSSGYSHAPTVRVSDRLKWGAPSGWFREVRGDRLRKVAMSLDRYYRSGIWWNDRISIALGYLWSALTTVHAELSFAALCMALEAVATTASTEVTHTLAERCAVLSRPPGPSRLEAYGDIKQLYSLRSKIVHGRSGPRKGAITYESLAITAKMSMVPQSKLFQLLAYVIDVIVGALANKELRKLLHVKQSDAAECRAVDDYFHRTLLARGS